jgi:hypothetical protein
LKTASIFLGLAFVAFVGCAGCALAWKARRLLAWDLPYYWAVVGQAGVCVLALAAAVVLMAIASAAGVPHAEFLLLVGLGGFFFAWSMGLGPMIQWHAKRARDRLLIPFRLRSLQWSTFFVVFEISALAGALAYAGFELDLFSQPWAQNSAALAVVQGKPLGLRLERDLDALAARLRREP